MGTESIVIVQSGGLHYNITPALYFFLDIIPIKCNSDAVKCKEQHTDKKTKNIFLKSLTF